MSDAELRRADELLTDLVDLVETARAVPMSASCIVPREHTLDLLDGLREVLPAEMAEARRIVGERDRLLSTARAEAAETRTQAESAANAQLSAAEAAAQERTAAAEAYGAQLVADARVEAARAVEDGQRENARLVSSAGVHQAATEAAGAISAGAEAYAEQVRMDGDAYAASTRAAADVYAAELRRNAEDYAERTLREIVATLQRSAATAERGRAELAARAGTDRDAVGFADDNEGRPEAGLLDGPEPSGPLFDQNR